MQERSEQKKLIIDIYSNNVSNKSYRQIADLINDKFGSDYWDSERVRDVIRKNRKRSNRKEVEQYMEQYDSCKPQQIVKHGCRGVLNLADLHIPFNLDCIFDIVRKHKNEIDIIVLSGDILDCFEISKFISLYSCPIEGELIKALELIKQIKKIVGEHVKIITIIGNHERRWAKYIASMHQKKLYKFLNPKVLEMLKTGFTLYENNKVQVYEGIEDLIVIDSWYVNIANELILCHPNNYSKADVRNAKMAIEYFITEGEQFSAVAVSHTHHQNQTFDYLGKRGFEVGCLCKQFDYSDGYTSKRKNINGYALFKFDENNKLNINQTQLIEVEVPKQEKKTLVNFSD